MNETKQIKFIIFDWGGVCTRGHLIKDFARNLAAETGVDAQKAKETFDSLEDPYEIGRIEPERFWEGFRAKLGLAIPARQIQAIFISSYVVDPEMLDYILELKKEYKTALLTNNYQDMLEYLKQTYKIDNYFDEIFNSSEIHLRKPDKEIYLYATNKLEIIPSEAVFVDDKERNTAVALALGFKTITFKDVETFKKDLRDKL
jgi:putative hydrolase of the HAD superfamily